MADDKPRSRDAGPAADNDDTALYLAEHTDLSPNQARDLIRKHGNDLKTLMDKARTIKAES
jgi:hypothetical protein